MRVVLLQAVFPSPHRDPGCPIARLATRFGGAPLPLVLCCFAHNAIGREVPLRIRALTHGKGVADDELANHRGISATTFWIARVYCPPRVVCTR